MSRTVPQTDFWHKYDHISPVLKELHWSPFDLWIEYKVSLITYKAFNDAAPKYIKDLLESNTYLLLSTSNNPLLQRQ